MPLSTRNSAAHRFFWRPALSLLIFFAFFSGVPAAEPIRVIATLPVLKDFAERVGGGHVEVQSLITGLESEHTYTPKPSDILLVRKSDILIKIGLGLEVWVNPLIQNADRPDLPIVTTSDGVPLMRDFSEDPGHSQEKEEKSTIDREHAFKERHTMGNPHIWLDPHNVKIMVRHITDGLIRVDRAHSGDYLRNQADYLNQLEALEKELKQKVDALKNRNIVTHHAAWPYYAKRFGFSIKGNILNQVGSEPSAKQMSGLVQKIRKEKIQVIISEPQLNQKIPQMLADETGAKIVVLSPLPGAVPGTESYLDLIRYNTETLISALGGS